MNYKKIILVLILGLSILHANHSADAAGPAPSLDNLLIPDSRIYTWDPGVRGGIPSVPTEINIREFGARGDGETDDTDALKAAIKACPTPGAVYLPAGSYIIKGRVDIPSGIVLRGDGIENTHILATPGVGGIHTFGVYGTRGYPVSITATAGQGSYDVVVAGMDSFSVGQTVEIEMDNDDTMLAVASGVTRGQIVKVVAISGNTLTFDVPLRLEYPLDSAPRIYPIYPARDVGFEDFHVKHVISDGDQSSIFDFRHVINSWIKNVESEDASRYHMVLYRSRHITIRDNVIHHSHNYGGGGHGYGISTGGHTSDSLITNNTLYMLRHSLISGYSSGNIWSYNFSADDNSQEDQIGLPDIALHGNYTHMELLEGNVSQWLHIGDYWGQSPKNTLFRNRVLKTPYSKPIHLYRAGIEINSTGYPSHGQNIIGNTSFGRIQNSNGYHGEGDYAENLWIEKNLICRDGITGGKLDQSTIVDNILSCDEAATWELPLSLYLSEKPDFWPDNLPWPAIGADIDSNRMAAGLPLHKIPAQIRYEQIMGLSPDPLPTFTPSPTSTPVVTPREIIIDDLDSGFSTTYAQGMWQIYEEDTNGQHYGRSHYYNSEAGVGQDVATWAFTVLEPGSYDVYAWWWEGDWRPSDVPYTVNHFSGNTTVRIDQQTDGGQWNLLGTYYFEAEGSITVSDDVSSGRDIVADAVRLVYRSEEPPEIIPTSEPTNDIPSPTPDTSSPESTPPPNSSEPTLMLDAPTTTNPNQVFQANVVAKNISDPGLYGTQFEINYDPALISVGNLNINSNLSFVVRSDVDDRAGKITVVASQQGRVSGLTNDVTLLNFEVTALQTPGVATFSFSNQKFSDFQAQALNIVAKDHSLTIAQIPTTEPTPQPTLTFTPTSEPTPTSTTVPTSQPTPTKEPTVEPTATPTTEPTPTSVVEPTSQPTLEPTQVPTSEPTSSPTPQPVTAAVSGQILLAGRTDNNWSGATAKINSVEQLTTTGADGNFEFVNVSMGLHSISADAPGYLSAVCSGVSVTGPQIVLAPVSLLAGDINDDDVVDIVDAATVGTGFGQTGAVPADITQDQIVDIFDIVLVSVNYGEEGPQTWNCN